MVSLRPGATTVIVISVTQDGQLIAPDSTPTVTSLKNGAVVAGVVTVGSEISTGLYPVSIATPADYTPGDVLSLVTHAVIGGTTYDGPPAHYQVSPPADVRAWVGTNAVAGAIPAAAAGAANGLHKLGANVADVTYTGINGPAMFYTGGTNSAGVVMQGTGSGHGLVLTPGFTGKSLSAGGTVQYYAFTVDTITTLTGAVAATNASNDIRGIKLHADGLDALSAESPTAVATTFRQKVLQLWDRFFGRVEHDEGAGTIKTKTSDGVTTRTTQTVTTSGDTTTVGAAS